MIIYLYITKKNLRFKVSSLEGVCFREFNKETKKWNKKFELSSLENTYYSFYHNRRYKLIIPKYLRKLYIKLYDTLYKHNKKKS